MFILASGKMIRCMDKVKSKETKIYKGSLMICYDYYS